MNAFKNECKLSCKEKYLLKFIDYEVANSSENDCNEEVRSGKWSDPGHFLKSQDNIFLSLPCTLFLHIFDI